MSEPASSWPAGLGRHREIVIVEGARSIRERHEARLATERPPSPDETPELESAWRSLQLHWLATVPGYRDEVKRRVSEAAKRADRKARRFEISDGIGKPRPRYVPIPVAPRDERDVVRGLRELLDNSHEDDVDNLGREIEGCG